MKTEKFIFVNEGNIVKLGSEMIYQFMSFNDAWTFAKNLKGGIEDSCQHLTCTIQIQPGEWINGNAKKD